MYYNYDYYHDYCFQPDRQTVADVVSVYGLDGLGIDFL
jgi:hypothetical protein